MIEVEPIEDDRGSFARLMDEAEFSARGLSAAFVQCSMSFNRTRGTLRGMHHQVSPHREVKLVRCTRGSIYDVIVDLRSGAWFGVELSAENHRSLYVPAHCAHGFQTLADSTEVFYQITERYHAESARVFRWDDPSLNIRWPAAERRVISERDAHAPDFVRGVSNE